jgi:phosphoribosylformylglycinamidine cyclo-ligase
VTYADAGVNLDAADEAVRRIASLAASTARPGVIEGIGGFGGSFSLAAAGIADMAEPVLVSSTDGVGTKLAVAQALGRFDTVGIDLVAMCVDDLVCVGAEPLFLLDYISMGRLEPDQIEVLVGGIADGCRQAGCALLGGELAEHPGEMEPGKFDLAGFAVGIVDRSKRIGPALVRPGDVLIGLASPGLRSNGYSLARRVLPLSDFADELLRPSVVYTPAVLAAVRTGYVHAAAHITGGGIPGNLVRALPDGCEATVNRSTWTEPAVFGALRQRGGIASDEMDRVFNLGIGMILVVDPDGVDSVTSAVAASSVDPAASKPMVIGAVAAGHRVVRIVGGG